MIIHQAALRRFPFLRRASACGLGYGRHPKKALCIIQHLLIFIAVYPQVPHNEQLTRQPAHVEKEATHQASKHIVLHIERMSSFHPSSIVSSHSGYQNISTTYFAPLIDSGPKFQVQLNLEEEEEEEAEELDLPRMPWALIREPRIPHISVCWCTPKGYRKEREMAQRRPPPSYETSLFFHYRTDTRDIGQWDQCYLLSLPKELRLEIWKYVLTDPSLPNLKVNIMRAPSPPRRRSEPAHQPQFKTVLEPPRVCPINPGLLRVNRFIYNEALPILYNSVRFHPFVQDGIFPVFLDSLPSYAPSLIRHVRIRVPAAVYSIAMLGGDPSTALIHWAITCAQLAKLESLRDVEVQGCCPDFPTVRTRRGVLNPLCKIKARKRFLGTDAEEAQRAFEEAERGLKAQAERRQVWTKAEAAQRAKRDEERRIEEARKEAERNRVYPLPTVPTTEESTIDRDISQMPGIDNFEKELEELTTTRDGSIANRDDDGAETEIGDWELVSLRSGASTPKPHLYGTATKQDEEQWADTASTIVEQGGSGEGPDEDSLSEQWEDVKKGFED